MAIELQPKETNIYRIVQAVIQLVQGRSDSVGDVTLAVGQTQTMVKFANCSKGCRVFLQPQNAAAWAAQATVAAADNSSGSFIIRHPSAAANCLFSFQCTGG